MCKTVPHIGNVARRDALQRAGRPAAYRIKGVLTGSDRYARKIEQDELLIRVQVARRENPGIYRPIEWNGQRPRHEKDYHQDKVTSPRPDKKKGL